MPTSQRLFVFTDDADDNTFGSYVIGTLTDWVARWKAQSGRGHRQMSYYLLTWSGDSTPPCLHYVKIVRRSDRTDPCEVRVMVNGLANGWVDTVVPGWRP